jgi:hypothetical protein
MKVHKMDIDERGNLVEVEVRDVDPKKCPHFIFAADHYREDGSCKCDDPEAKEMADWGYVWTGEKWETPECD